MKTILDRVLELEKYSEAYYAGKELISDASFDALEEELRQLDPDNAWFKRNRETAKGGFGTKFPHFYQFIGSINKIHSIEESKILTADRYVLSAKLDGTSLVTYFTNGKLDRALTRGDGYYGLDVTDKFLKITEKYKWAIPTDFTGAIRGEVVFSLANWEKFKALHPEAKAPRNSGTGLVNNKVASDDLQFVDYLVYDVVAVNDDSCEDYWKILEQFNLPLAPRKYMQQFCPTHEMLQDLYVEWSLLYPLDGIVIRDISPRLFDATNSIFYYAGIKEAYKFQAETKTVEITAISWQMGRTGKFTPVVGITPTVLSGAIVQNVTAHNAGTVKEKGIGVGAEIAVYRSGEVIPYLHEVLVPATVNIPTHCPHCSAELVWTASGKDIICENSACPMLRKLAVYKYLESICRDIKGLGDVFLDSFVFDIAATDILSLLAHARDWGDKPFLNLGRADNIIAEKVLDALSVECVNPEFFLVGLGIPLLGNTFAKELASDPEALKDIFNEICSGDDGSIFNAVILKLPGRVALANKIVEAAPELKELLLFIAQHGRFDFKEKATTATATRYYAITGSLSKSRKEIEADFAKKGWEMTSNISKAECLVNNDSASNSSKNVKAKSLGKPILTEAEFCEQYIN